MGINLGMQIASACSNAFVFATHTRTHSLVLCITYMFVSIAQCELHFEGPFLDYSVAQWIASVYKR